MILKNVSYLSELNIRWGAGAVERAAPPPAGPCPPQLMPYWVYILKSEKTGRHYIGYTANLKERIRQHNEGLTPSTRCGAPWKLVYKEKFASKKEACRRERQIKSYKGGEAFWRLLGK